MDGKLASFERIIEMKTWEKAKKRGWLTPFKRIRTATPSTTANLRRDERYLSTTSNSPNNPRHQVRRLEGPLARGKGHLSLQVCDIA